MTEPTEGEIINTKISGTPRLRFSLDYADRDMAADQLKKIRKIVELLNKEGI
jgi:hypothetical protein